MVFFLLTALVAAGVSSPYVAVVLKRKRVIKRLSHIAKKSGFRVIALHGFAYLSTNFSPKYDFLFECRDYAYAVKLLSSPRKSVSLVVKDGRARTATDVSEPMIVGEKAVSRVSTRGKPVRVTANNYKVKKGKAVVGVLLHYPPFSEITVGEKKLSVGDKLFDKLLYSAGTFENELLKNAPITLPTEQEEKPRVTR